MQMGARRTARIAHSANFLPLTHALTNRHNGLRRQMGISRPISIAMINLDPAAITNVPLISPRESLCLLLTQQQYRQCRPLRLKSTEFVGL